MLAGGFFAMEPPGLGDIVQPVMHVERLYMYLPAIPAGETSVHILSVFLPYFLCYSFLAVPGLCGCVGLSLVVASRSYSLAAVHGPHCDGFSSC